MTRTRSDHRKVFRFATALSAVLGLALLSGCKLSLSGVFNLSGPQSTMLTEGPVARSQWDLFMVTVYVTAFIFIVVGGVLAYAQIKFRAKSEADERFEPPPQGHGNPLVEIGLIAASVGLLVIIAIPTLQGIWYTHDVPEAEKANTLNVTVTGHQWWWQFDYPTEMMQLPNNGGEAPLVTANELVVPIHVPVLVKLRTVDVIHSFWVPKLAGKVDMIPNRPNYLWFEADKPGYYYGQCAEYCGEDHAIMRFRVIALPAGEYVKWLNNQKQSAKSVSADSVAVATTETPHAQFASLKMDDGNALSGSLEFDADPLDGWRKQQLPEAGENPAQIALGRKLFQEKTCFSCHTIRGHEGIGVTGPDLTHVGARSTIAAGVLENTHAHMHAWIKNPNYFKPGNKMFFGGYNTYDDAKDVWTPNPRLHLNDQEIDALVAYLHSLK